MIYGELVRKVRTIALIIGLTLLSGMGDAIGFVHAARVWHVGSPVWIEFAKSSAGFAIGIGAYWFSIRYLNQFGDFAPELQALAWFTVTLVAMAILNRTFFAWQTSEQLVALSMVGGIGWLLVRTGS